MEYICGDLLNFVRKRTKINENIAKIIFKQIILGLKYIHSKNIVHRDIKLDNILIDLENTVKICDFGVSRKLNNSNNIMHEHCGTPVYIAPEIYSDKGYSGYGCDIWSLGVTLYYMVAGIQPFKASNLKDLQNLIKKGKFDILPFFSPDFIDLIQKMLTVDVNKRIDIEGILHHKWLKDVDVDNRKNLNLFSNAEKILYSKFNIDYINEEKEELLETFTLKNLDTIDLEKKNYGNTKSLILAPFNTYIINYEKEYINYISKELKIENDIMKFKKKPLQSNIKYELNNNKECDNGMIKTKEDNNDDDSININCNNNKYLSPIYLSKNNSSNNINETFNEKLLKEIENEIGYDRKYLLKSLKKNEINYATETYYLLNKNYVTFSNV